MPQAEQRPAPVGLRTLPRHQDTLDGLRAVAAAAVLLTHVGGLTGYVVTGSPASWVISRGDVGVPISGQQAPLHQVEMLSEFRVIGAVLSE